MSTAVEATSTWADREVVAGTIVGEASAELFGGQVAVACVIRNRVMHPRWWGKTWRGVCLQDKQFSCWNDQLRRISDNRAQHSTAWALALQIADGVIGSHLPDVTLGCDHYYADYMPKPPSWATQSDGRKRVPVLKMGAHLFFRLELPDPAAAAAA